MKTGGLCGLLAQPPVSPGPREGMSGPSSQGLLVPRTETQCPAVEPLNWGVLLVWEWLPGHLGLPSEVTHVLTFLRDSPLFTVRQGGQAPSGPGGEQAGPVWLVPPVTRPRGPSDLKQDPVSAAPGPGGGADSITSWFKLLKGSLPPRNLSAAESRPPLHSGAFLVSSHY